MSYFGNYSWYKKIGTNLVLIRAPTACEYSVLRYARQRHLNTVIMKNKSFGIKILAEVYPTLTESSQKVRSYCASNFLIVSMFDSNTHQDKSVPTPENCIDFLSPGRLKLLIIRRMYLIRATF